MLTNTKIFQIYFKAEQIDSLDPAFSPLDNTVNPRPDLQEWYLWDQHADQDLDHWGFVSWRFKEKTNLSGDQITKWISDNPGYDVYLINPAIINEAVFANGWEQGEHYHPGISAIADNFLAKLGYTDYKVIEQLLDRTRTGFATYFVASRDFWQGYMEFSRQLFVQAEQDAEFKYQVFADGLSGYARNPSLPMFTFLNERLLATYMDLHDSKVLPYQYTEETIADKYRPYFSDISALSDLKVLINQYESDELYQIWDHYRRKFLQANLGVLNLE